MAKTILFTGGHHNSSLVLALALQKQGYKVSWIGHKFTMRGDKVVSAEYQEVTKAGIPFTELKTGKFYHRRNPLEFLKIGMGFLQSFFYLLSNRPQLIVSFGGYLAVPVVISGWILGIPSVTHEQTVTAGWANRAIAPFVRKIFVTHASSLSNYPRGKTIVTGLPLREELLNHKEFATPPVPIIYITCGKQGSQVINAALFPIIPELVKHYKVVHQTGSHTMLNDQDKARRVTKSLPDNLRNRYLHQPYFFTADATRYLKTADIIVSRSGAHITYELLLLCKKSVVIPIPWVSHNEQFQNAELLQKKLGAVILPEDKMTPESLLRAIQTASELKLKSTTPLVYTDATARIIKLLQPFLS